MKRLDLKRREVDTASLWRKVAAEESHYDVLIDEPFAAYEGGELKIVYLHLEPETTLPLLSAVKTIEYTKGYRTVGLKSCSKVFGYQPRLTIRRDFCTAAAMAKESPRQHGLILEAGARAATLYRESNQLRYDKQRALIAEKVLPEWRLPGEVYTSGIVNWDNQLRYHFDAGNFVDCWSAMYTFKHDMRGGYLSLPEFGIGVELRNSSLLFFDGAKVFHGVTPFVKKSLRAYRYTTVFYALRDMCKCQSAAEELARIREVKTTRELKRGGLST